MRQRPMGQNIAEYKGKKIGSIGDVGAYSFCQNKTFVTGGEGGMMSLLEMEQALPYIHRQVGFNYRMTEMQSAIGLKELEKLDSWNLPQRRKSGELLIE